MKHSLNKYTFEYFDYLDSIPRKDKVKIGYHLNRYEWIDLLPGKPDNWEELDVETKHEWVSPILKYIKICVGEKAFLRYAHKIDCGTTDQEFDDWWDSSFCKEKEEFYNRYNCCNCCNNDRNNSGSFVKSILAFCLGLLIAFFAFVLISIGSGGG